MGGICVRLRRCFQTYFWRSNKVTRGHLFPCQSAGIWWTAASNPRKRQWSNRGIKDESWWDGSQKINKWLSSSVCGPCDLDGFRSFYPLVLAQNAWALPMSMITIATIADSVMLTSCPKIGLNIEFASSWSTQICGLPSSNQTWQWKMHYLFICRWFSCWNPNFKILQLPRLISGG